MYWGFEYTFCFTIVISLGHDHHDQDDNYPSQKTSARPRNFDNSDEEVVIGLMPY